MATAAASGTIAMPAVYLLAHAKPRPEARERIVALAPVPQDAGAAEERERERQQRGGVVEREMAVEHGQKRHRLERRREQAHPAAEEARAEQVEQPHRAGAEQRDDDARHEENMVWVRGVFAQHAVVAAEPHHEHRVQHVGERGWVYEVVRVQPAGGHRDSLRHEMAGLVDVVDVGQPRLHAPQPQREGPGEHERESAPSESLGKSPTRGDARDRA